jgi:ASCH domain
VKAISIKQPWTFFITHGTKRVENRSWNTYYRGLVLLHAGLQHDREAMRTLKIPAGADLYTGGLVGVANLVDCLRIEAFEATDQQEWAFGPWCLLLRDVRAFSNPVAFPGMLGFFDVPEEIMKQIPELGNG